jgi:hypothetical protein
MGGQENTSQPATLEQEPAGQAPTFEQIRTRAFEIHVERGGIHGFDLDDWLQAERELLEKYAKSGKPSCWDVAYRR